MDGGTCFKIEMDGKTCRKIGIFFCQIQRWLLRLQVSQGIDSFPLTVNFGGEDKVSLVHSKPWRWVTLDLKVTV